MVNEDPMGEGWFFKMKIEDASQLDEFMDEAAYKDLVG
jgi:glycine cleavage system H protein